jgi:voltage-gated potassium channel
MARLRARLRGLYNGHSREALRFQAAWLVFDALLIAFFMVSPFLEKGTTFLVVDYIIAAILLIDLAARAWCHGHVVKWLMRPLVWADLAVLASLIVPVYAANLGFLRILRAYSLIHGQALWRFTPQRWAPYEETIKAVANLLVFVFMMTALVHTSFAAQVPQIQSYMDSLYFTVTSLSTTGYGDITLPGAWGRTISIIAMLGGVTLFFRMIQVAMRPPKVRHPCPACGLQRHEIDAVHCKACGTLLNIPDDND